MTISSFNDGWSVRPKTSIFAQIGQGNIDSRPVRLPHDALIELPRVPAGHGSNGYHPESVVMEYSKEFHVPAEWADAAVRLQFEGAYRDAVVFVNNVWAGHQADGYSGFDISLDDHLRFDTVNTVRVEVRAHDDSRWYPGCGITRSVWLHVTDPYRLDPAGVWATTPDIDEERAVIEVNIAARNGRRHRATTTAHVSIVDADGVTLTERHHPVTLRGGGAGETRARLYLPTPRRWSIEDPYLYTVHVTLREQGIVLDETTVPLGVRTLQLDPVHGLRVNGERVLLRGASVHADNGVLGAAAVAGAEERRVRLLKSAGFNALRSAHNPMSVQMIEACDRLGMLVMDELTDVWFEGKSGSDSSLGFADQWRRDLSAMVSKDRNHPSVIMYSIGNEILEIGSPAGAEHSARMTELIRNLDDTRLITNGINGFVAALRDVMAMMRQATAAGDTGGVNDAMASAGDMMNQISASPIVSEGIEEASATLDVVGINYGDSRYALDAATNPDRILVGSETFPARIDVLWDLVRRHPTVLGDFTWAGWDYLGEVGIGRTRYLDEPQQFEAPFPWISASVGDLDMTGHRRAVSFYREIVFGLRDEPYIAVHRPQQYSRTAASGGWSWPDAINSWTWNVQVGAPIRVDVYAAAEEIELLLDGHSRGRAQVGATQSFIAEFDTTYEPGLLEAVAYTAGAETGRTRLRTAGEATELRAEPSASQLTDDSASVLFVELSLRDERGALTTAADREVSVTLDGPGVLAGVMSGRPDPSDAFTGSTCLTLDGRALAVVRPNGTGQLTLRMTAGTLTADVTLPVGRSADRNAT